MDTKFLEDNELWKYRIIKRKGPRDNMTNCESDIVLINVPSKRSKRFHGTYCDDDYIKEMYNWVIQFEYEKEHKNDELGRDLAEDLRWCYQKDICWIIDNWQGDGYK